MAFEGNLQKLSSLFCVVDKKKAFLICKFHCKIIIENLEVLGKDDPF